MPVEIPSDVGGLDLWSYHLAISSTTTSCWTPSTLEMVEVFNLPSSTSFVRPHLFKWSPALVSSLVHLLPRSSYGISLPVGLLGLDFPIASRLTGARNLWLDLPTTWRTSMWSRRWCLWKPLGREANVNELVVYGRTSGTRLFQSATFKVLKMLWQQRPSSHKPETAFREAMAMHQINGYLANLKWDYLQAFSPANHRSSWRWWNQPRTPRVLWPKLFRSEKLPG